jgi:hypothetical protein
MFTHQFYDLRKIRLKTNRRVLTWKLGNVLSKQEASRTGHSQMRDI